MTIEDEAGEIEAKYFALRGTVQSFLTRSPGRWISTYCEQSCCSSCGAKRTIDYGDDKTPTTIHREPCSRNCPWAVLEAAVA